MLGIERLTKQSKQFIEPQQHPMRLGAFLLFVIWLLAIVWLLKVGAIKWVWSVYGVALELESVKGFTVPPKLLQSFLLGLFAIGTLTFAFASGLIGRQTGIAFSRALVQSTWHSSLPTASAISLLYSINLIVTAIWEVRLYLPI